MEGEPGRADGEAVRQLPYFPQGGMLGATRSFLDWYLTTKGVKLRTEEVRRCPLNYGLQFGCTANGCRSEAPVDLCMRARRSLGPPRWFSSHGKHGSGRLPACPTLRSVIVLRNAPLHTPSSCPCPVMLASVRPAQSRAECHTVPPFTPAVLPYRCTTRGTTWRPCALSCTCTATPTRWYRPGMWRSTWRYRYGKQGHVQYGSRQRAQSLRGVAC